MALEFYTDVRSLAKHWWPCQNPLCIWFYVVLLIILNVIKKDKNQHYMEHTILKPLVTTLAGIYQRSADGQKLPVRRSHIVATLCKAQAFVAFGVLL